MQLIKKLGISNVVSVSGEQAMNLRPTSVIVSGFEQKLCFAVSGGNKDLLAHLNEGLAIVFANGTYDRLYKKWFGPILPKPSVSPLQIIKYLLFILLPILFLWATVGAWYLRRELARKTEYLIREIRDREQAEEALRQSMRKLTLNNRIKEIFLTTPDDKMYEEVLAVVLDATDSKFGTFAYINEDGDRVVPSMT